MSTMAIDQFPDETHIPSVAMNREDLCQFGWSILTNPQAMAALESIGALGSPPTSNPRFWSTAKDSEKEGVLQNAADFLVKLVPPERSRRFGQKSVPWNVTTQASPVRPMAVAWEPDARFSEAILGFNPRDVVPQEDIMHGCHLRGVVKIVARFSGGSTVTGSGVLIDKHTVATVGHLLASDDGHAKDVKIWAGQGSGDDTVEYRDGTYVAVHFEWYDKRSHPNDLAFIRLSEPFDTVNPIKYTQTPITNNGIDASIYGFPYDMPDNAPGDRLCVSKSATWYSQSCSPGMLEHKGDTEKGTSGGPVVDDNGTVIALHRGWANEAGGGRVNQAIAIDRNGNDFWAFRQILEYMSKSKDVRVKMLGEVKKIGGFAFAW